jgi:peptidoglycan hydrolase-like protein with peptidoglycan-binding domain
VEHKSEALPQQIAVSKGAQLYVSAASIRQIQENLKQQDFYAGEIDGILGPGTQQAIRKYEQEKGLQATGTINLRLINTLGLSQMVAGLGGQPAPEQQPQQIVQQEDSHQQQQARGYYGRTGHAEANCAPLYVSPLAVRQIQMSLKQNGYAPGPIDGQWGQNTSQAIEQFQKARNLVPTGNLNITTARILLGGFELDSLPMGTAGSGRQNVDQRAQQ